MMKNGLKFYAASNGNSSSDDQARSIATSLVHSSHSSVQSRSLPPPYNSLTNTTVDQTIHSSNNDVPSLNLQLVFDYYFEKEELKDDNQYRCEHCRYVLLFSPLK
jgi:ubiquitin C-terminal hydrolase